MIVAYILAKVEAGKDEEVISEIRKMLGVKQAVPTYGFYDLHIEVSFDTMDEFDRLVFEKIRRVIGIKETITLIVSKVK